jgi:hypothetical protein
MTAHLLAFLGDRGREVLIALRVLGSLMYCWYIVVGLLGFLATVTACVTFIAYLLGAPVALGSPPVPPPCAPAAVPAALPSAVPTLFWRR